MGQRCPQAPSPHGTSRFKTFAPNFPEPKPGEIHPEPAGPSACKVINEANPGRSAPLGIIAAFRCKEPRADNDLNPNILAELSSPFQSRVGGTPRHIKAGSFTAGWFVKAQGPSSAIMQCFRTAVSKLAPHIAYPAPTNAPNFELPRAQQFSVPRMKNCNLSAP